jgi:hypothetical protein
MLSRSNSNRVVHVHFASLFAKGAATEPDTTLPPSRPRAPQLSRFPSIRLALLWIALATSTRRPAPHRPAPFGWSSERTAGPAPPSTVTSSHHSTRHVSSRLVSCDSLVRPVAPPPHLLIHLIGSIHTIHRLPIDINAAHRTVRIQYDTDAPHTRRTAPYCHCAPPHIVSPSLDSPRLTAIRAIIFESTRLGVRRQSNRDRTPHCTAPFRTIHTPHHRHRPPP